MRLNSARRPSRPLVLPGPAAALAVVVCAACSATLDLGALDANDGGGEAGKGGSQAGSAGKSGATGGGQGGAIAGGSGGLGGAGASGSSGAGAGAGAGAGSGGGAGAAAGSGGGGGLSGSSGSPGAGAGGVGAGSGAAGAAGTGGAGGNAGVAGGGAAGIGGAAGSGGQASAGAAGASGGTLAACPGIAPALHSVATATSGYIDVSTDGSVLSMVTSDDTRRVFTRSADLAQQDILDFGSPFTIPLRNARQVDKNLYVYASSDHPTLDVIFVGSGTPPNGVACEGSGMGNHSTVLPKCSEQGRVFAAAGGRVAMAGCGRQAVASYTGDCGQGPKVDLALTEGDKTTYGMTLTDRLYVIESTAEPTVFAVRYKTVPSSPSGSFDSVVEIDTIEDGIPAGAVFEAPYLYTSVRSFETGKSDIRRFTVGQTNSVVKLHTDIEGLSGFAVKDGRVTWAQQGGARVSATDATPATASVWRGAFNGQASGPSKLVTCLPSQPSKVLLAGTAAFFVDSFASTVDGKPQNPSLRGVSLAGL